ncbi:MAG: NUDIX hydrolase [Blautia sp.]|nr:NUDIX hydrolase [Lachnoclostridium sp.]MCM1210652.1 NUDIX hydrolase [Blautia sp.]
MEKFERLKRTLVHKGAIIDYYQDTVKVPNGNVVTWDFIGHKGAAAVVPVNQEGKILMVRQYRNALDRETLEVPAGGLDSIDEPTDIAALRELEEETGYQADKLELLLTLRTTVAFCNEKIDVYVATGLKPGSQHLDEDEFINVEAYAIEELLQMIYDCKIQDGKTVSALLAYKNKYCNYSKRHN